MYIETDLHNLNEFMLYFLTMTPVLYGKTCLNQGMK